MDIRPATPADLPAVQQIVETSYADYIPLIGRRPAPMDADYAAAIEAGQCMPSAIPRSTDLIVSLWRWRFSRASTGGSG